MPKNCPLFRLLPTTTYMTPQRIQGVGSRMRIGKTGGIEEGVGKQ